MPILAQQAFKFIWQEPSNRVRKSVGLFVLLLAALVFAVKLGTQIVSPEAERARHFNRDFSGAVAGDCLSHPANAYCARRWRVITSEVASPTARNQGHSGIDGDVALRDAINAGRVRGPRILASWRPGVNLRSRARMDMSRVSIPPLPRRSCNRNFWR